MRVTHDKIFVDLDVLRRALIIAEHESEGVDYIHSSTLTPGTGFEIITTDCLTRASLAHKNVEHITYAVRPISKLTLDLVTETEPFNLLIDFPEDLKLFEVLFRKPWKSSDACRSDTLPKTKPRFNSNQFTAAFDGLHLRA